MNSILITGGAGFVGAHLALGLKRAYPGARVVALDNLHRKGSELNPARLAAAGVEFVRGDVRNPADLDAVGPVELLIECSAEPSVQAGITSSPRYVIDTNLVGAINCFEYAREQKAGVVFLSTSRVYPIKKLAALRYTETLTRFELMDGQPFEGASARGVAENFSLDGPRSIYGTTKLSAELLLQEYSSQYGIPAVIDRCGVIAGPGQFGKVDQGIVTLWVARHFFDGKLSYIGYGGTGKQVRDVLHVDDLLRLVLIQIERLDTYHAEIFNVGGGVGNAVSLCELTEKCARLTGKTLEIAAVPETRAADVPIYVTDNTKVSARTGWRPEKSVDDVLANIHWWISENEGELRPIFCE